MNISSVQTTDTDNATRVSSQATLKGLTSTESTQSANNISVLKPSSMRDESQKTEETLDTESTKEVVDALNDYMEDLQTNLRFAIRDDLGHQVVVEIKNRKTDELVKQIPSEELLKIMENMKELTGIIFDQSV